MTDPDDDAGRTSWFIPGETCPLCDGPVASDGRTVWCTESKGEHWEVSVE